MQSPETEQDACCDRIQDNLCSPAQRRLRRQPVLCQTLRCGIPTILPVPLLVQCVVNPLNISVRLQVLLLSRCCRADQKLLAVQAFIPGPLQTSEGGALQPPVRRPVSIQDPSDGSQPVSFHCLDASTHVPSSISRPSCLTFCGLCMFSTPQPAPMLLQFIEAALSSMLCVMCTSSVNPAGIVGALGD